MPAEDGEGPIAVELWVPSTPVELAGVEVLDEIIPSSIGRLMVPFTPDTVSTTTLAAPSASGGAEMSRRGGRKSDKWRCETEDSDSEVDDDEAEYQAELNRRESMRVRWRRSPLMDVTRRRLLEQVSRRNSPRTTQDDEDFTNIDVLYDGRPTHGCVRGGGTAGGGTVKLSACRCIRTDPELVEGDSGNGGLGHGALNPAHVAHGGESRRPLHPGGGW